MTGKKYDVVLSYADEDREIAADITLALRQHDLSYYDFYEQVNWGGMLMEKTLEVYGGNTHCVLAVISKSYVSKYWPSTELKIAQLAAQYKKLYLLALYVDDPKVDALPDSMVHMKWRNNPGEVAAKIIRVIRPAKPAYKKWLWYSFLVVVYLGLAAWLWNTRPRGDYRAAEQEQRDSVPPPNGSDTSITPYKPPHRPDTGQDTRKKPLTSDYTISGTVAESGTGRLLDSVAVTVLGKRVYTDHGSFIIVLPGLVKEGASYTTPINVFLEKQGYDNATLTENVLVDAGHVGRTINAMLTKLN